MTFLISSQCLFVSSGIDFQNFLGIVATGEAICQRGKENTRSFDCEYSNISLLHQCLCNFCQYLLKIVELLYPKTEWLPQANLLLQWANGNKFVGEFSSGLPSGEGVYETKSGDIFVGRWLQLMLLIMIDLLNSAPLKAPIIQLCSTSTK